MHYLTPAEWAAFLRFAARLGYPNPDPASEICEALVHTWRLWEQPDPQPAG